MKAHVLAGLLLLTFQLAACQGLHSGDNGAVTAPSSEDDALRREEAQARAEALAKRQDEAHAEYRREQQRAQAEARMLQSAPAPTAMGAWRSHPGHGTPPPPHAVQNRENYAHFHDNPVRLTAEHPVSTFSVDVDRGSYSNVRRILRSGALPPHDAVRAEEFINAFDYGYTPSRDPAQPFALHTALMPTPWNDRTHLLQIGLKGYAPIHATQRPSNLVFLVDVSGSMSDEDRLPLARAALKALARTLTRQDRISLVVYAGSTGVVLEPTPGDQRETIERALDELEAGGSTNGGEGIRLAYAMARKGWLAQGNNRVILCTDGDFNVGVVNFEQLLDLVKEERKSGVALTTLGFGAGNYNDQLMEQLANVGNGNYAYIDSMAEARRVLVEERNATLMTIAQDVKLQLEFNPAVVKEYRLIGYENRALAREDFNNDQVDAGEVGAGHSVTALYELTLMGAGPGRVDPLRYGKAPVAAPGAKAEELGYLKLRFKYPGERPRMGSQEQALNLKALQKTNNTGLRLAASVAAFAQLLRGGTQLEGFDYERAIALAKSSGLDDPHGRVEELLDLMAVAQRLNRTPIDGGDAE